MKFLIESGMTSLEQELRHSDAPTERRHLIFAASYGFNCENERENPFCLPAAAFNDLTEERTQIVEYLVSLGLTASTKVREFPYLARKREAPDFP